MAAGYEYCVVSGYILDGVSNSKRSDRDSKAIQLKLNELLGGVKGARTGLVNLESLSDEGLMQLHQEFERLGERAVSLKNAQKPKP